MTASVKAEVDAERLRRWMVALLALGGSGTFKAVRRQARLVRVAHGDDAAITAHQRGWVDVVGGAVYLTRSGRARADVWRRLDRRADDA